MSAQRVIAARRWGWRCQLLWAALAILLCSTTQLRAQVIPESPYAAELRTHYYEQLAKQPWRAFGWELLCPGAGNYYVGLDVPALATLAVSLAGAGMWIGGAVRDERVLRYAGIGTFAAGRAYGLVSAPIGAVLLNAAFRQQLGIRAPF